MDFFYFYNEDVEVNFELDKNFFKYFNEFLELFLNFEVINIFLLSFNAKSIKKVRI